ncbi:MAG: energy transducer TonB [Thermodesulfobacteriota bacterium]|nr:energy transducer TonB [Thermodesulfobacteriota bacterium]
MHSNSYLSQDKEYERRTFFLNFSVSFMCHLILFVILIFAPGYATNRRPSLSVINVSMVSLPALKKSAAPGNQRPAELKAQSKAKKKAPDSKVASKTIPATVQKPSKAISIAPKKKKIKKSLKKKTFKSARVVKSAITQLEKKIEKSRPDQIRQAIDRLKDQVKKTGPNDRKTHEDVKSPGIAGEFGPGSKKALELIDIYRIEVAYQIQNRWAFSEQLAGGQKNLEAYLALKVMPNGEIKDIWFDKRSGNSYFDESAKKAIMKSNPVRPHPPGVKKPFVTVGLRFTPEGIK